MTDNNLPVKHRKFSLNIRKTKKKGVLVLSVGAVTLLVLFAVLLHGVASLKVTEYNITADSLPTSFNGFRIAQVSDLHNARFGKNNSRLIERLKKALPDIIVITGDLVDSSHTDINTAADFVRRAVEIAPVYYVSGNHEAWLNESNYLTLKECLAASGAVLLENQSVDIFRGDEHITLAGVDDPDMCGDNEFFSALDTLSAEKKAYTVLLSHRPEYFEHYMECGFSLVLSGHTHAGQIRLPFIGAVVAPGQGLFPEYDKGLFKEDGAVMIVSAGLGNSVIPFRLFNTPEIVVTVLNGT